MQRSLSSCHWLLQTALMASGTLCVTHTWAQGNATSEPKTNPPNVPVAQKTVPLAATTPIAKAAQLALSPNLIQQTSLNDEAQPIFIFSDNIQGVPEQTMKATGNVELRRAGTVLFSNELEYSYATDTVKSNSKLRINRHGDIYEGEKGQVQLTRSEGTLENVQYHLAQSDAKGDAQKIELLDDKHSVVHEGSYSTCPRDPGPRWLPDWILKANRIVLDKEEDEGEAYGSVLYFKDVPILPMPYVTFPLTSKRKTGFLPPTLAIDSVNGLETVLPYYWNIAPNRDATLYPVLASKRGVALGAEFRYLERNYNGNLYVNAMPNDRLRDDDRWGASAQHTHTLGTGLTLGLNLNRVSDDNYWRDFSDKMSNLSQRLLPADADLSWTNGRFSTKLLASQYQTLQDEADLITEPFDRLPQWSTRYTRSKWNGFDVSLDTNVTRFKIAKDANATNHNNADRAAGIAQISYPIQTPGWFVTPKARAQGMSYQFENTLSDGKKSASKAIPSFGLDTGLNFERDTTLFGRAVTQTLEPRLYYTYTPYRDQSAIPIYDSALNDINFTSTYLENAFSGYDRIADNNMIVMGLGTRFLDPNTGKEWAKATLAQRYRFQSQRVTLPGASPIEKGLEDLLLGASSSWSPNWTFDTFHQYSTQSKRMNRSTLGVGYSPSNYRTVYSAYRYTRDSSEALELGWQWPLNDLWGDKGKDLGAGHGQGVGRWYSVGRLNYSLYEKRLVDSIIGFEYDEGCWIGRIALENTTRGTSSSNSNNQRILFQLELIGLGRLGGSGSLRSLQSYVPRYQLLRTQTTDVNRFTHYE